AVNNADSVEEMQAALENEDLGLNLDAYNALSADEKAEVAARVLENRPKDDEGYPLPDDIQAALDQAVDEVGEEDPEEPGDGDEPGGMWFSGEGAPGSDLGENGDLYLDEGNFDIYKKEDDEWNKIGNLKGEDGEDGEDGKDGIDGATWFVGEGEPAADEGEEGDLYLDSDSGDVYIKSAEGWSIVANLQGPEGPAGPEGPKGEKGEPGEDCDCEDTDNNGDHDGDSSQDGNKNDGSDDDEDRKSTR